MTYEDGNPNPDLGQAQKSGGVKLHDGIRSIYLYFFVDHFMIHFKPTNHCLT